MTFVETYTHYKQKLSKYWAAIFFTLGFLVDIFTLSRIDDWVSILQQGVYLVICLLLLDKRLLYDQKMWEPSHSSIQKLWSYHNEALHFLLGSLLSTFALFFFLSSSFFSSFIFLAIIFVALVLNEHPWVQKKNVSFKYALVAICLLSYFSYLIPIALGYIGVIPFLLALAISSFVIVFHIYNRRQIVGFRSRMASGLGVLGVVVILYFLKVMPPVPLSLQHIGIYHGVEKSTQFPEAQFVLKYERPFWKFWQKSSQNFKAYSGDKVYCFARIFSPVFFKDQVVFHWSKKQNQSWQTQDRILSPISGGRAEGFRSYSYKENFESGHWRVQIETQDGREIGRVYFHVEKHQSSPPLHRVFQVDYQ